MKRGCGRVWSMDGLWKLAYPICMAVVEGEVSDDLKEFIPNVCTNTPSYGKAFCEDHCKFVTDLRYQTNLREFLKSCSDGEVEIDLFHHGIFLQSIFP